MSFLYEKTAERIRQNDRFKAARKLACYNWATNYFGRTRRLDNAIGSVYHRRRSKTYIIRQNILAKIDIKLVQDKPKHNQKLNIHKKEEELNEELCVRIEKPQKTTCCELNFFRKSIRSNTKVKKTHSSTRTSGSGSEQIKRPKAYQKATYMFRQTIHQSNRHNGQKRPNSQSSSRLQEHLFKKKLIHKIKTKYLLLNFH